MSNTETDIKSLSFEQAMAELETVVGKLEGGQVPLEDSISLYERGAALRAHCEAKLKEAELKIEKLVVGANGTPTGTEAAQFD